VGSLEHFLPCNAPCGLRFHRLRIGNVCEGNRGFQGISVCSNVWQLSTFFRMKCFFFHFFYHRWTWSLVYGHYLTLCESALAES